VSSRFGDARNQVDAGRVAAEVRRPKTMIGNDRPRPSSSPSVWNPWRLVGSTYGRRSRGCAPIGANAPSYWDRSSDFEKYWLRRSERPTCKSAKTKNPGCVLSALSDACFRPANAIQKAVDINGVPDNHRILL
jgi:hypothetical protein